MAYSKKTGASVEFQGESFTKSLIKDDGSEWMDNEDGSWKLFNTSGNIVANGTLTRSDDNLSLTFLLGKSSTTSLFGIYRLLVYLSDTVVTEMNYVIAEYKLDYKKTTARND